MYDVYSPSVQKDFEALGRGMEEAAFMTENFDMDLFFKMKRLQILYLEGQDYVRMKLRTMLKIYGYKRRTQELLRYFRECLMFYHRTITGKQKKIVVFPYIFQQDAGCLRSHIVAMDDTGDIKRAIVQFNHNDPLSFRCIVCKVSED